MSRRGAGTLLLWFWCTIDASLCTSSGAGTFWHNVELRVEVVERGRLVALVVVPPVAHKEPLVEHGAVGAQKRVVSAVFLANVEDLALCVHITIVPSVLLVSAAEFCARDRAVDRVVLAGRPSDGWPGLSIMPVVAVVSVILSIVMRTAANVLLTGLRTAVREAIGKSVRTRRRKCRNLRQAELGSVCRRKRCSSHTAWSASVASVWLTCETV